MGSIYLQKTYIDYEEYGFHITKKGNMESIIKNGLLPLNGERSISVGEEGSEYNRVYFFTRLVYMGDWKFELYRDVNSEDLEVLKFPLKGRMVYTENGGNWFLVRKVIPSSIEFLRLHDLETNEYVPFDTEERAVIEWIPISEYKPFVRKR